MLNINPLWTNPFSTNQNKANKSNIFLIFKWEIYIYSEIITYDREYNEFNKRSAFTLPTLKGKQKLLKRNLTSKTKDKKKNVKHLKYNCVIFGLCDF